MQHVTLLCMQKQNYLFVRVQYKRITMQQTWLIKVTYILTSSILISGCALTGFQIPNPINAMQIVAHPSNSKTQPIIALTRPFSYSQALINYIVKDNNDTIGLITNNSYLLWNTNKGNVTLSLEPSINPRCYSNDDDCLSTNVDFTRINTSEPITEFTFKAISGNTYYLTLKPQWQLFTDTPSKVDIMKSGNIDLTTLNPPIISIED